MNAPETSTPKPAKTTVRTTCPRDCYDACGMVAVVRNGRVGRILGDPEHPRARGALCGKCALAYNGAWLEPQLRLAVPLKRTGPKGQARFAPVTWELALADIAERLKTIIADHGAESVLHTHYTGTNALIAGNFPSRFFNRLGATEVDPDTVCNKAGHDALRLMFGSSFHGFDPATAEAADCLIVWGANPSASAPHVHKHWLPEVKRRTRLIVVDPIRHDSAALADLHLQPRPGSDALLAFGMLHVLRREGRLDEAFLGRSVLGWDSIAGEIDFATPERTAQGTGVPAGDIEQAARWYGAGRSLLWLGQGLQRQATGGNVIRSVALLPTATGNIGRPGTGFLYMNAPAARGIDLDWLAGTALRPSPAATVSHMDLAPALAQPERFKALFTWNNNIAASNPDQARLRRALAREDLFHVAVDLFATDTTAYADYILPAASFIEFDDLVLSYFDYTVSAQVGAMAPLGESLPNQDIFRRLARAMGWSDPALYQDDADLLASMLDQLGVDKGFAELAEAGTLPWRQVPVVPFADGRFPTPSGRIEVASARWLDAGMPLAPAAYADEAPRPGRLRVLSPSDPWLINSSYANDSRIARQLGEQTAWLHPDEMRNYGLRDGQAIVLRNATGRLSLVARTSDRVPPGVALVPKGRWPSREGAGANVNCLNPGEKCDLGESTAVHSVEAEVVV